MKVIAASFLTICLCVFASNTMAANLHVPPWPLYMNGVPVDASGNLINLPYCWRFRYYVPLQPHGAGIYNTGADLQFAYSHNIDCLSTNAVLQWPDPRMPIPRPWRSLPVVSDQPVNLYCVPAGTDYIDNSATHYDLGPLYRCQWPKFTAVLGNG